MPLSRITLSSGRLIELTELRMASTYAGVLEGYPNKDINDMTVKALHAKAELAFPPTPVHLVPPALEYPDRPAGFFGPVEVLPPVACIGFFRSTVVAAELVSELHRSRLAVVWFQSGLGAPSDKDADLVLRGLRWVELAQDYEL